MQDARPDGERPLVLVVEDNPANLHLTQALLTRAGYRTAAAGSLREARARLGDVAPDLILLDLGLPDGDGLDLMPWLRARPSSVDTPVMVVTAYAMRSDRSRALAAGCEGWVTKPVDTRSFAAEVGSVLARRRSAAKEGVGVGEGAAGGR